MKRISGNLLAIICLFSFFTSTIVKAQVVTTGDTYKWSRFETGGGGYFTGIAFSPSTAGLMYVRSDVAELHRMDPGTDKWTYTGDTFWPEKATGKVGSVYGIGGSTGIAVHPTDNQTVFTTYGSYGNFDNTAGVYRSKNQGQTWEQVLPVYAYGNNSQEEYNQRKCGNPIVIDTQNADVVYAGTQKDGLFRSLAKGDASTWVKISSIPNGVQVGTKCVVIDRFSAKISGRSSVVYASVYNNGVFKSTDGGDTFTKMTGSPKCPQWMVQAPDGTVYSTNENTTALGSTGGIWKCNGTTWSEITPSGYVNTSFVGLDVNPLNGNQLVAVNNGFVLFKSTNAGISWDEINSNTMTQSGDLDNTFHGGKLRSIFQAACTIHFDPFQNGTVYVCDAFMVWKSVNVFSGSTIDWLPLYKGLNNSIPFSMIAPPQAASNTVAPLYAGGADGGHYRYDVVGGKPAAIFSNIGGNVQYVTGMDFCEAQPDAIWVSTNKTNAQISETRIGWYIGGNLDKNTPWNVSYPYGSDLQTGNIKIAVSANNPSNAVIVTGEGKANKVTFDGGLNWKDCRGLPAGIMKSGSGAYDSRYPLEADRVNGNKFYVYHPRNNGDFYRSDDGGYNWKVVNTDIPALGGDESTGVPLRISAAPFMEGNVWVALGTNGLYKTDNSGASFTKVPYFTQARLVDFGTNKPNVRNPTVYVHGKEATSGQWGVFRSIDMGATWELVTALDAPLQHPLIMEADRKVFGRVFFVDEASGIRYGEITGTSLTGTAPLAPANTVLQAQGKGVKLTWLDNSTNENLFRIYRKKSSDANFNIIGLAGYNQTSYVDSTLESNTNYDFYVEAYNETGTNKTASANILSPVQLTTPTNLLAKEIADMKISITWQDINSAEDGFVIEYAKPDSAFKQLAKVAANTTTFAFATPVENVIYAFRVKAIQADKSSMYSNEDTAFVVNHNLTQTAINAEAGNAQINRDKSTNALVVTLPTSQGNLRVGRNATASISSSIFPFKLPVLANGAQIAKVQFEIKAVEVSSGANHVVQLWALPARDVSTVLTSDYYDAVFTNGANGTLIDGTFCNASLTSAGSVITSRAEINADFTNFIKSQYQSGAAGKYIFIRLSQSSDQESYRIGFEMAGDGDDNTADGVPQLLLSTTGTITGINEIELVKSQTGHIFVYPNPVTTSMFYIKSTKLIEGIPLVEMKDITGRSVPVEFYNVGNSTYQLSILNHLTAGFYFIRLSDRKNKFSTKVIIQ